MAQRTTEEDQDLVDDMHEGLSPEEHNRQLRRAIIEELYTRNINQINEREDNTDENKSSKQSIVQHLKYIHSVLWNPRKHGGKVTDVETRPRLPRTIESATEISFEDVEKVRFEIDGEHKTDWFKWNDRDSKVHNIVNYYSDGSISDLLSGTKVNYKDNGYVAEVTLPEVYNSRTSRVAKETEDRIRLISERYDTSSVYRTKQRAVSGIIFYGLIAVAGIISLSFSLSAESTAFLGVLAVVIHFFFGPVLDGSSRRHHSITNHYSAPLYPVTRTLSYVFKKLDRID